MKLRFRWAALALSMAVLSIALVAAACGGDDDDDDDADGGSNGPAITVSDAWARATSNDVSAAYMMIKNTGVQDRLISAKTDASSTTQIHEIITEGTTSKMQELAEGLTIPANGSVELKPGGYHVMIMDIPTKKLEVGQKVEIDLTFEKAGTIHVTAEVKTGGAMNMEGGMHGSATASGGHSGMGTATATGTAAR